MTTALTAAQSETAYHTGKLGPTGPSFAAALCGFLSTTVATTMVMFLLSSL